MASARVVAWQNAENSSNTNPWVIGLPGGAQAGDLLLAFVATNSSAVAFATPSGWTQLATTTAHGDTLKVMYQFPTSTANQSWPTNGGYESAVIYRIRGAKPATVPSISSVASSAGSTNPDPPSVSPGSTKDWLYLTGVGMLNGQYPDAIPSGYSTDSGWSYGDSTGAGSGASGTSVHSAFKATTATSTENPGVWACSVSVGWAAYTIAVENDPNNISIVTRGAAHSTPGAGTGSTIAVTPTAGGAGHLYLCAIGCAYNGGGGITSVTGGGLTWSRVRDNASSSSTAAIWQATGTLTTATVTATFISGSNAYDRFIAVFEVIGTTTIAQQYYTAGSPAPSYFLTLDMNEYGQVQNRPFVVAMSMHTSDGTAALLLGGDLVELDFQNGYDSLLEGGFGGYYGWVAGWSQDTQDPTPYAYDQTGYPNQYMAIIALELGSPWTVPTTRKQVTDANTAILNDTSSLHRNIDHTQNGVWWTRLDSPSTFTGPPRFFYSSPDLKTWTYVSAMTFTSAAGNIAQSAFFIDKDDYMHVVYTVDGGSSMRLRYRRGTPNAARTSYTWGSEYIAQTSGGASGETGNSSYVYGLDVIAFKDGANYQVFFSWNYFDGGAGYWYSYCSRASVTSGGVYSHAQLFSMGGTNANPFYQSLDFRHTATDDKAVQASTPSVYWADLVPNSGSYIRLSRIAYSAGPTWTHGGTVNVDGYGAVYAPPSLYYDGTRIVIGYVLYGQYYQPSVTERDETNSTTTQPGYPLPQLPGSQDLATWAIAYDDSANIYFIASDQLNYTLRYMKYTRASSSWGGWTTLSVGRVSTRDAQVPRAQASASAYGALPILFEDSLPATDVIYSDLLLPSTYVPSVEEGWGMPIFVVPGAAPVVDTFYPSEDGHVRCVATGGTYASARGGTATFTVNLTNDGSGFMPWGQAGPTNPFFGEDFFAFDTSSIPDGDVIDSVVFSLNIFIDNTASVTNVCEVRAHTWTAPITSATFVTGANLSAKTLLATVTSAPGSRFTANAYKDFTSTGSFAGAINKTGLTQVMVVTDRMTAGTTPGDDETIHPYYVEKGTTFRPKLVVTHHA